MGISKEEIYTYNYNSYIIEASIQRLQKFAMFAEVVIAFMILFLFSFVAQNTTRQRSPPRPWALPVIGNLISLVLDGCPHHTVSKWATKYGPIFSYQMGSQTVIVISDFKLVKQLFSTEAASGRPKSPVFSAYSNYHGVLFSDGSNWEIQRHFLLKTLKLFGFGKASTLETQVTEEFASLAASFENNLNVPIAANGIFFPYLTGLAWGLFVSDVDVDEKHQVAKLVENFMSSFNAVTNSGLLFFPGLRFIAPGAVGWTRWENSIAEIREFVAKRIEKNKAQLDASRPSGLIDRYLAEMESTVDQTSTFYKESGYNNLLALVTDMFIASTETTGSTLEWTLLYLSQHKDVQRRLQDELDDVIGSSRTPYLSDRQLLPYTEAVILEILRFSSIVPTGFPHRLQEDIEFHGYHLQKDSLVVPNLYNIFNDASTWGSDSGQFRPERFLKEEGSTAKVVRNEAFIPFSIGKRKCLGETMAMDTLFLFVTSIFQTFNVDPDPDCPVADLRPKPGITLNARPFRIVMSLRAVD